MFLVVVFVPDRLPCKFHGDYHGYVLILFRVGYHGGMIGNNIGEVFLFLLLFFVLGKLQWRNNWLEH
jgi:hypothetical protein